jgi:hypothetical protein
MTLCRRGRSVFARTLVRGLVTVSIIRRHFLAACCVFLDCVRQNTGSQAVMEPADLPVGASTLRHGCCQIMAVAG